MDLEIELLDTFENLRPKMCPRVANIK